MFSLEGQTTGEKRPENKSGKAKLLNIQRVKEEKQLLQKLPLMDKTSEKIMKLNNNFESHCKVLK